MLFNNYYKNIIINDNNINNFFLDQINNDLNFFDKNDLDSIKLDEIMENPKYNLLVRFKIINHKLYYYKENKVSSFVIPKFKYNSRYKYICAILLKISKFVNDVDFIISLQDFCNNKEKLPILTFAKDMDNDIEKYNILIPDWLTLRGNHKDSWVNLKKRIDNKKSKFSNKINKIIWRGRLPYLFYYRRKFVEISKKNKFFIDFDYNYVKQEDHLKYKYQIVFDGARCTWPGYLWRLYSGCLTIKHESNQIQWFYNGLKPYVHYVPLKKNFNENDLLELLEWLNKNQDKCESIANNAEKFVSENLKLEDMFKYYINLLNKYSQIQCCSRNLNNFTDNILHFNQSYWYYLMYYLKDLWIENLIYKLNFIYIISFILILLYFI